MHVCPQCLAKYDDDVRACPFDGRRPLNADVVTSAAGDVLLGTTLAGKYTIVGRVGAGGMGTVYRAEQAPMAREVALKVLRRDLGRDPETVARFHREAHTLSALKHPNTVTIFDFGQTDDGLLFLAMELLEGEMLSVRMKREGPFEVDLAIRTASGVLRSLAEAHTRGIIHRDLKPDNIFLAAVHGRGSESEMVKVVDFGIAKIRDGDRGLEPLETQEGTVFGTPRYMSPEQAQGKSLDGRSDLYAVGVLMFHMLTGQPPFVDDDAVIVMAHHIKTVPPPLRKAAPGRAIHPALERLVARALEKDASERPQTAEAFLAALEDVVEEMRSGDVTGGMPSIPPSSSDDTGETDRDDPRARRRLAIAVSGIALVSVLAVGGISFAAGAHVRNVVRAPSALSPLVTRWAVTMNRELEAHRAQEQLTAAAATAPPPTESAHGEAEAPPATAGVNAPTAPAEPLQAAARQTAATQPPAAADEPPIPSSPSHHGTHASSNAHVPHHGHHNPAGTGSQRYPRWTD